MNYQEKLENLYVVYMNLASAFDEIDHNILMNKLKNPCIINLLSSYLTNKFICVHGEKSKGESPDLCTTRINSLATTLCFIH